VDYPRYNTSATLVGTMFEFGRYTLSYQPPEGAVEAAVDMSISSEADLPQMLAFFESFLQAAGYVIEGKELTLERREDFPDFPNPYVSFDKVINFGKK
jgi:hypothetical protein